MAYRAPELYEVPSNATLSEKTDGKTASQRLQVLYPSISNDNSSTSVVPRLYAVCNGVWVLAL